MCRGVMRCVEHATGGLRLLCWWLRRVLCCCCARACYGVLRFVMESGAKGCEVIVSGKLRAQRAKSMKFKDGYMVSSGYPAKVYIDSAVRHVLLRQGVLGIKVGGRVDGWVGDAGIKVGGCSFSRALGF